MSRTSSLPAYSARVAERPVDRRAVTPGELDRALALAFAPMYKLAFGVATGTAVGLVVFLVTAARLLLGPPGPTSLALLAQFFAGYRESWAGAFVGLAWGFGIGFVAGWFAAFLHNLVVASWVFVARARADLAVTRGFLDHI